MPRTPRWVVDVRPASGLETGPKDLRRERTAWRTVLAKHVLFSLFIFSLELALIELVANPSGVAAINARVSLKQLRKLPEVSWNWSGGIGTADSAVIVTALLLFVVALNVALAAVRIGNAQALAVSAGNSAWANMVYRTSQVGGATALAVAMTQVMQSPAMCIILTVLAGLAIAAGGSIAPDSESYALTSLRRADLRRRLEAAERMESSANRYASQMGVDFGVDTARNRRRSWTVTLIISILAVAALTPLIAIGVVLAADASLIERALPGDWLGLFIYIYLPSVIAYLLVTTVLVFLRIASYRAGIQGSRGRRIAANVAFTFLSIGFVALSLPLHPVSSIDWAADIVGGAIVPVIFLTSWGIFHETGRGPDRGLVISVIDDSALGTSTIRKMLAALPQEVRRRRRGDAR